MHYTSCECPHEEQSARAGGDGVLILGDWIAAGCNHDFHFFSNKLAFSWPIRTHMEPLLKYFFPFGYHRHCILEMHQFRYAVAGGVSLAPVTGGRAEDRRGVGEIAVAKSRHR